MERRHIIFVTNIFAASGNFFHAVGGASERRLTDQVIKAHHSSFPFRVGRKKFTFCDREKTETRMRSNNCAFHGTKKDACTGTCRKVSPDKKLRLQKSFLRVFPAVNPFLFVVLTFSSHMANRGSRHKLQKC